MPKFEKGHKKVGGRKPGSANIPCLHDAIEVYEEKGGKEWLARWVDESAYNKREFVRLIMGVALKQVTEKREVTGSAEGSAIRIEVVHLKGDGGNGNGNGGNGGNGHADEAAK